MFDILTNGFKDASLKLKGHARITEANIEQAMLAVRKSLLDADVDLKVTKTFLKNIKNKALGNVVATKSKTTELKVSAAEHFINFCHEELIELLGGTTKIELTYNNKGPTIILLAGLQGSGKTTHAAKLAKLMKEQHNKRPLLIAADVYRPAAKEQLKILGNKINVPVFTLDTNDAVEIAKQGVEFARNEWLDLVIIDTAGRLAIDETLMSELENIKSTVKPQNVILVIDSMIGQDAVRTASAFDNRLNLSGVILTKLDGDTRGGAALSIKTITNKHILFIGTGESLDKLEEFRPEGMAGRILGMGDVIGLMHDFNKAITEEEAINKTDKLLKGKFNFDDFIDMMGTVQKMGPIKDIISKTGLSSQIKQEDMDKINDNDLYKVKSIVQSMTKQEKNTPELFENKSKGCKSRMCRIAKGSGHSEKEIKDFIDKFMQMREMMSMMSGMMGSGGGLLSKIPGLGSITKMANMAKAMKNMGGMNLDGMSNPFEAMMGATNNLGVTPKITSADLAELNRLKKKKKEAKLAKQKKK